MFQAEMEDVAKEIRSKFCNVFVQILDKICVDYKTILSKFHDLFVRILKYL